MYQRIGVVGYGVVGDALVYAFRVKGYDGYFIAVDPDKTPTPLKNVCAAHLVFICVPTPMRQNGEQDLSIITSVLSALSKLAYKGLVVIKSTTTPLNVKQLLHKFQTLRIVTNPEFLTQRSARMDFVASPFIIMGGQPQDVAELERLYRWHWPESAYHVTTAVGAMFIKYMLNTFFATKVTFLNECYKLWEAAGDAPWGDVIKGFITDPRAGTTHSMIPGPDGQLGFGGKCFPKDLQALMAEAAKLGTVDNLLRAVWDTNIAVREDKDWLSIEGAVTKEADDENT